MFGVSMHSRVNVTYVGKDGERHDVRGKVGDNVLYLAHRYGIDMEGRSQTQVIPRPQVSTKAGDEAHANIKTRTNTPVCKGVSTAVLQTLHSCKGLNAQYTSLSRCM